MLKLKCKFDKMGEKKFNQTHNKCKKAMSFDIDININSLLAFVYASKMNVDGRMNTQTEIEANEQKTTAKNNLRFAS